MGQGAVLGRGELWIRFQIPHVNLAKLFPAECGWRTKEEKSQLSEKIVEASPPPWDAKSV